MRIILEQESKQVLTLLRIHIKYAKFRRQFEQSAKLIVLTENNLHNENLLILEKV